MDSKLNLKAVCKSTRTCTRNGEHGKI